MNLNLTKLIQLFRPKRKYSLKWVFFLSDADPYKNILHLSVKAHRDGFRGGGGRTLFLHGFDPLPTQRESSRFVLF